ncbi:MAG: glycine cleavage system protein GcvH [Eubacterium sp.]|jgi:glycine cleavage system H protein|uniref:glycine cleavage system protein GcvH n=1 Tax=Eubacterium sp. F2 TaxID=3381348 RepID=UPI0039081613|nr:glycine cleavage system protein GcvH [Eubacterium sp.]MCI2197810.1 glycine cleavage system protein GcvH [Eubacterium sp.]
MNNPQELKYSKSHEWVRIDGDAAYIGITDHAQESLGDLVFVNLPEVDDEITAGDPFGDVESVKAVSDLLAPVDGVVAEINEELLDAPEKINEEPYEAWMIKITEIGDTDDLLDADEYERFVEEEEDE